MYTRIFKIVKLVGCLLNHVNVFVGALVVGGPEEEVSLIRPVSRTINVHTLGPLESLGSTGCFVLQLLDKDD